MDVDAAVAEQIEIAIELHHLLPADLVLAHIVAERGEVASDVAAAEAGLRPERIDDLIALINRCRSRKLPEVAGVIEVHMPEDHIINVGGLDADLGELG